MDPTEKPATLLAGMGSVYHPVATANPEAQKFFNQGLAFVYAFNHDEAIRSFKRASELDPTMAMAYWGIALALGPNINLDVDPAREKAAFEAAQKALALSAKSPENERAYIEAVAKRYSIDPNADLKKLAVDYKNAMGALVTRYPDDLNAATLYAESAMNLRPWRLWSPDGQPAEGTEEIVAVLESVLRRDPNHIGAIHYYIHAIEASPNPDRAMAYAPRLPQLIPAAGHLVHMPAHIYQRTGDYQAAARSNKDAALADEAYFKSHGDKGLYPVMYYCHNLHFLAIAHSMSGRFSDAFSAAQRLETYAKPAVKEMPMAEGFVPTPTLVLIRFGKWTEILRFPAPDKSLITTTAVWHFARGMAFAGKRDSEKAEAERAAFLEMKKAVPAGASFGLNSADSLLQIADVVLAARIAEANHSKVLAVTTLLKGIDLEDALAYDEPPYWFMPVRELVGGALLRTGDFAGAEVMFRQDLQRNRRNGRSLFGLMEALRAQKKDYATPLVQREFEAAWKDSDTKLSIGEL